VLNDDVTGRDSLGTIGERFKSMAVTRQLTTAGQLERMPRDPLNRYELVQGELVRMTPVGGEHGVVAVNFVARLVAHVKPRHLGAVMVEVGYRLTSDPDTVRAPDISFLAAERIPPGGVPAGFVAGAPDLAIEVVSPDDAAAEIEAKVQGYLAYGTRLVLVVHPRTRTVTVYRRDGTARVLRSGDMIDGEDVVPDFQLAVDELFSA
jgi:Uma2 family endonuclease